MTFIQKNLSQIKANAYKVINLTLTPAVFCYEKLFFPKRESDSKTIIPQKILLCNIAHLGDVIIATSILPVIKQYYPEAKIGFLAGSWAKVILHNHPLIDYKHYFDHYYLNRSKQSWWKKIFLHLSTRTIAKREITNLNYDLAIDLYAYYPSLAFFFWLMKIPRRAAYNRRAFPCLLTDPKSWQMENKHIAKYHLALVSHVLEKISRDAELKPVLAFTKDNYTFAPNLIKKQGYIILHPGSGAVLRNWPQTNWIKLKKKLLESGFTVVLTGAGSAEQDLTDEIKATDNDCINLCNKLSWDELVTVIAKAKLLVGVDSCASHITAALDTPSVVIIGGMVNYIEWQPLSRLTKVVYKNMPCVPCYNHSGCSSMECIRGVDVEQVMQAINYLR